MSPTLMLIAVASLVLLPYPLLLHHVKYILVCIIICIIIFITVKVYRTNRLCFQQLFHMGYVFTVISEYHIDIQLLYCIPSYFEFSLINKFSITFCLCNPQLLNLPIWSFYILLFQVYTLIYCLLTWFYCVFINSFTNCSFGIMYVLLFHNTIFPIWSLTCYLMYIIFVQTSSCTAMHGHPLEWVIHLVILIYSWSLSLLLFTTMAIAHRLAEFFDLLKRLALPSPWISYLLSLICCLSL